MKRLAIIIVSAFVLSIAGFAGIAHAGNVRTGDVTEVKPDEVIDGSFYMAGDKVKVAGIIKGDLFCAGNDVEITGTVEGDVICAGQTLQLGGRVLGDARIAGMQTDVSAHIAGSLTMAAQVAVLQQDSQIGRDISMYAENAKLKGQSGRDVRAFANFFTLEGAVARHLHVRDVQSARIEDKAKVGGEFVYTSTDEAQIADGADVQKVEHLQPEADEQPQEESFADYIMYVAFVLSGIILIAFTILGVSPVLLDATSRAMRRRHVWAFALGLAVVMLAPLVAIIVMLSGVGLALGIIIMMAWLTLLLSALSFTTYTAGTIMTDKMQLKTGWPRVTSLSLGFVAAFIVALIPFVNVLVFLFAIFWGVGGVVIAICTTGRGGAPTQSTSQKTVKKSAHHE